MRKEFQAFHRFLEKLEWIQIRFCVCALAVIVAVLCLEILLRHLAGVNLQWALDLSALLMVWICFIGTSVVFRRKGHIGIEALVKIFPGTLKKTVTLGMSLLMGAGFVLLMVRAGSLMMVQRGQDIVSLGISRSFLSLPVVAGMGLMILATIYLIWEELFTSQEFTGKASEKGEGPNESY